MTSDQSEAFRTDDERRLAPSDLADLSGLTEDEVLELVEYGALATAQEAGGARVFTVQSIAIARTARRLREEFELEPHGIALMLACLDRIRDLEARLRALEARLPR